MRMSAWRTAQPIKAAGARPARSAAHRRRRRKRRQASEWYPRRASRIPSDLCRLAYVVATNTGVSAYDDVRLEYCALTNLGIAADAAVGTNADASANHSAFFNNCARMDD